MKGLIFSEVTIEEQIVWPKADSGPQKTRKKMVWRVQQQENIYRITLHFLVRKNETAECHWKRRDKGKGLAEKQTQERSKPLTIALKKKKKKEIRLLASPFKGLTALWSGEGSRLLPAPTVPVGLGGAADAHLAGPPAQEAMGLARWCHVSCTTL